MTRVLVVDDDAGIRLALRSMLEDEGYEVSEAEDGAVALDVLRRNDAPYVVLLDYMMPHMDGLDVLSVVENDATLKDANTFIFMTAGGKTLPVALARILATMAYPL